MIVLLEKEYDFYTAAVRLFQERVSDHEGYEYAEDAIRDGIIEHMPAGYNISPHEVIAYFPFPGKLKDAEQRKDDLDIFVVDRSDPSAAIFRAREILGMESRHSEAIGDLYHELCKPDGSTYFMVLSSPEHSEAVGNASRSYIRNLMSS